MTFSRTLLAGLTGSVLLLGSAASVMAQPPQGQGPGVQGRGPGGPGGRGGPDGPRGPEQRAERLHQQLGITSAQEQAFAAFVAATNPGPENRPNPEEMRDLTTPQRLDRQLAELQGRIAATNRLYGALNAEQKAAFDDLPPQVVMGGGGRGGRGGPGEFAQGPDGPGGPGQRGGRGGGRGQGGDYQPQ